LTLVKYHKMFNQKASPTLLRRKNQQRAKRTCR